MPDSPKSNDSTQEATEKKLGYRTAPEPRTTMPPGIPFIVANEAAERFSYYGMLSIMALFMTEQLCDSSGQLAVMDEREATEKIHLFKMWTYLFPFLGALLSDGVLGKYRTIISLSLVYCLGHLALSLDVTRVGLFAGMALIALGSGGIKPCVSAHVGDQFGDSNKHLIERVFGWFYISINLGAAVSSFLIPWVNDRFGPHLAFGIPGVLMFLATLFFWLGRYRYAHVPPAGMSFVRAFFSPAGWAAVGKLSVIFAFMAVFWSLFDQTHSKWILQAKGLNRSIFGLEINPAQIQTINPLLITILVPLFSFVFYPALDRIFGKTPSLPLKRMAIGFFITAPSFAVIALIQRWIDAGETPYFAWQLLAYGLLTSGEVMVSITALEFSYTQAPIQMKSLIMALNMSAVALGNGIAASVNSLMQLPAIDAQLKGERYYWFFSLFMLTAAVIFLVVVRFYKPHTYIQQEEP